MPTLSISVLATRIRESLYFAWSVSLVFYVLAALLFFNWQLERGEQEIHQQSSLVSEWINHQISNPIAEQNINTQKDRVLARLENLNTSEPKIVLFTPGSDINFETIYLAESSFNLDTILTVDEDYSVLTSNSNHIIQSTNPELLPIVNPTTGFKLLSGSIHYFSEVYHHENYRIFLSKDLTTFFAVGSVATLACLFLMVLIVVKFRQTESMISGVQDEFSRSTLSAARTLGQLNAPTTRYKFSKSRFNELIDLINLDKFVFEENRNLQTITSKLLENTRELLESLETSQEELQLVTQLTPVGVFTTDKQGLVNYANPALIRITGLSAEQLVGSEWINSLAFPDSNDQTLEIYELLFHDSNLKKSLEIIRPDSSVRNCLFESVKRFTKNGDLVGFVCAITDITELKETEKQLATSESRWQFALTGSGQGVWDWQLDSGNTYYSDKWASMIGYKRSELSESIDQWYELVHDEDLEQVKLALTNHLDSVSEIFTCEHRLRTKDGAYIWFQAKGKIVERDNFGRPLRMIGIHTDISDSKLKEAHIHHLAYHDQLTDLPNRMLLKEEVNLRLSIVKRYQKNGALLFLDLDRFKIINDTMGHHKGDQLLKKVAQRLTNCIRSGDLLARLGGDEFVILLGQQTDNRNEIVNHAHALAEKVLESVAYSFDLEGSVITSGASIGITIFPEDGSTYEELLKHADTAMYQAKKQGRNRFHFYQNSLEDEVQLNLKLENDLRKAIHKSELELHYQPKVDVASGRIVGAEALLRWRRKDGNLVSPGDFIPIAEETGLILPLGDWVIINVLEQLQQWQSQQEFKHLHRVAINVSAQQFRDNNFLRRLGITLNRFPGLTEKIEFEVTESAFIHNLEETRDIMKQIRAMGISIAVDDFGTGFSSLAYLKVLPVDVLKIDRAFIRDLETDKSDASLVKAIVNMSKALELETVAEGVENRQQLEFLKQQSCEYFQGYFCSPALPADQFFELVKSNSKSISL